MLSVPLEAFLRRPCADDPIRPDPGYGSLAFLTLPGLALAAPAPPPEAPRALSEAERQAVVLAAEYLDRGPAGLVGPPREPLAPTPARPGGRPGRDRGPGGLAGRGGDGRLEAAPRGDLRGAVFTLGFPSGVDDTLVLGLVREDGAWKIDSLRISAEPVAASGLSRRSTGSKGSQGRPLRRGRPRWRRWHGRWPDPRLAAPRCRGRRRPAPGRRRARAATAGAGGFRWGSPAVSIVVAPWPPRSSPA